MVLEVRADAGQVGGRLDAQRPQVLCGTDTGQQEQLRGADRARAQDDLGTRACLGRDTVPRIFDPGALACPREPQAGDQAVCLDGQVGAMQDRPQVRVRGADPVAAVDGQVDPGGAFLVLAAEVVGELAAPGGQGRHERLRDRVPVLRRHRRYRHRAVGAAQCRVTAGGPLAALETGQQVGEPPALRPGVVDGAVPADVRHRVDGAGAAEGTAARVRDRAGVSLGGGQVPPVRGRAHEGGPGTGNRHLR
jgi:hypothetical protein